MSADEQPLGRSSLEGLGDPDRIVSGQHAKLGEHLWVYLLQVRPEKKTFPLDALLYYRLEDVDEGGNASALDLSELAYGGLKHPSFYIPSKLQRILHGSCRKPHGGGSRGDALARGDALLAETYAAVQSKRQDRPALLLLTGDQIYADDVAVALAALLRRQGTQLTGFQEVMPGVHFARDPLHGRKLVLKGNQESGGQNSGFSSGESENHLFSFGEFAAMYLYVLGNADAWTPSTDWEEIRKLCGTGETEAKAAFEAQQPALMQFHASLGRVRKLLANIPTYMIFDDHDVTDDWNITRAWYDGVRSSPLGTRIVSNALAAYWAFQGWGNDPDNFDKDMVWSVQQRLMDSGNDPAIAERYDLHTWKHRGWGFSVPTVPPIIAMDSRTQRQYDDKNLPPQLMDRYALDWLRVEWAKLVTDLDLHPETCPVLVATAPVFGFAAIEAAQSWILRIFKAIARRYSIVALLEGGINRNLVNILDVESWIANKDGFKALFTALQERMGLRGCVFLSGDVHYAFSTEGEFTCNEKTLNCWQLTSSALSNMPSERNQELLARLGANLPPMARHGVWLAWRKPQRWSTSATLLRPTGTQRPIYAECNIGLVEFADGMPVRHSLLLDGGALVYDLPSAGVQAIAS